MPVISASSSYSETTSGLKIIKRALRLLGVVASGDDPEPHELQDALESLNGMLDTWNTDGMLVYTRQLIEKDMDGSASYTIGEDSNNDIVAPRPVDIKQGQAFFRFGNLEYEMSVYNQEQWAAIALKDTSSSLSGVLYYDRNFETGTINLWPVSPTGTLLLYLDSKLSQITQPTVPFRLPPGYYEAIVYNLAVRIAPEYGAKIGAEIVATALEAKTSIKRANHVDPVMSCDPALLPAWSSMDFGMAFGGGGSTPSPSVRSYSVDTTLPSNLMWLIAEGVGGASGITLTLPDPGSSTGHIVTAIKMDAAAGAVNLSGSMNTGSTYTLVNQNQTVTFLSDGTNWVLQSLS